MKTDFGKIIGNIRCHLRQGPGRSHPKFEFNGNERVRIKSKIQVLSF